MLFSNKIHQTHNKTTQFASEYTFQADIVSILRLALQNFPHKVGERWVVIPEAKDPFLSGNKRADIIIKKMEHGS